MYELHPSASSEDFAGGLYLSDVRFVLLSTVESVKIKKRLEFQREICYYRLKFSRKEGQTWNLMLWNIWYTVFCPH